MPLLNYTTKISSGRTAGEVMDLLVHAGAQQILIDYRDLQPTGIAFVLNTVGGPRRFWLPVDAEPVRRQLVKQRVAASLQTPEHAGRVAWRIVKDWVEAQLAIIETGMVATDQVFLPYLVVDDQKTTMFDRYRAQLMELEA